MAKEEALREVPQQVQIRLVRGERNGYRFVSCEHIVQVHSRSEGGFVEGRVVGIRAEGSDDPRLAVDYVHQNKNKDVRLSQLREWNPGMDFVVVGGEQAAARQAPESAGALDSAKVCAECSGGLLDKVKWVFGMGPRPRGH